MSRAYRVRVSESLDRVVRAEDHVRTQLEILEILPCEEMADLLKSALADLDFEEEDGVMVRERDGVRIEIDPATAVVTVRTEGEEQVQLEAEREGRAYDDWGDSQKQVEDKLRKQIQGELEQEADQRREEVQRELTDRLEQELGEIQQELGQAVNRVTREALRRKASRMGQIKEISEDDDTGSMTIVVEV